MFCQLTGNLEVNSNVGVILPTYCEAPNIERLISEIEELPLKTSVLVIDDSSPDGTAGIVEGLQQKYPNLLLLVRCQKSGLGSAITDGFRTFLSLPRVPEFVVTMDADYSHNPQDMPRLVSSMNSGCDLAIGSRYCAGGKTVGWPLTRKIVSRGANAIARGVLGLNLHDCTSGYRCYSTNFLRKTIGYLHSQTYDIQIETVKQAHSQGFRIHEVPILFVNRKRGKSKLSLREIENYVSYIFQNVAFRQNR
ncbi:MAG: polyprenol monophosphomannose synthase [Candidatus Bathyarchaeota archaeon]|nr:polyprenol monophosphomannose synthase [Candidatus Bathyarchaeota archaeon]